MEFNGRTGIQASHDEAALTRSIPGCKPAQASGRFQKAWSRGSGSSFS